MEKTIFVIISNSQGKILVLKIALHKKMYPGAWSIITGKFEGEESVEECFKREVREEIGITEFMEFEFGAPFVCYEKEKETLTHPVRCVIRGDKQITLNKEHTEWKWMSPEELLSSYHAAPIEEELAIFYKL